MSGGEAMVPFICCSLADASRNPAQRVRGFSSVMSRVQNRKFLAIYEPQLLSGSSKHGPVLS